MNKFVRVAGITVASILVVAGTVWAQAWVPQTVFQWKAPQQPFPNMSEITVPIDTGDVKQDRGGQIDFSKSSSTAYSLQFGDMKGGISVANGGQLPISGNLSFVSGTQSGIFFTDGSYQISAGISQAGKLCRVVIKPFDPGNGDTVPPSGPVYDTIPARDSWLAADCVKYASDTVPPGSGYTYPALLGCAYPGGLTAFGAPTAAGYWDATTLPNNCGWNPPPPPAAKTGVPPGFKERACPTYDWRTRLWTYCP